MMCVGDDLWSLQMFRVRQFLVFSQKSTGGDQDACRCVQLIDFGSVNFLCLGRYSSNYNLPDSARHHVHLRPPILLKHRPVYNRCRHRLATHSGVLSDSTELHRFQHHLQLRVHPRACPASPASVHWAEV